MRSRQFLYAVLIALGFAAVAQAQIIVEPSSSVTLMFETLNSSGARANADSTPSATVYLNGSASGTPSVTVTNVTTGVYKAVFTAGAWTAGDEWYVDASAAISSTTYNRIIGSGTADNTISSRLAPTTAGRTLDVTAAGEAGIDWANIGSPTTTVNLSGTTISTSQAVASVAGAVGSVTGNVGGNVTGSVGSVLGNVGGNVVGTIGGLVQAALAQFVTDDTGETEAADGSVAALSGGAGGGGGGEVTSFSSDALAQLAGKNFTISMNGLVGKRISPIGKGMAYDSDYGNAFTFSLASWPSLTALNVTTVRLEARHKTVENTTISINGTVTAARAIKFEMSSATTETYTAGDYEVRIVALIPASSDVIELARECMIEVTEND